VATPDSSLLVARALKSRGASSRLVNNTSRDSESWRGEKGGGAASIALIAPERWHSYPASIIFVLPYKVYPPVIPRDRLGGGITKLGYDSPVETARGDKTTKCPR